jgi:hypothetical protein
MKKPSALFTILCEALSFAPSTKAARVMVADALMDMCETAEQVRYVLRGAIILYTKWSTCGLPGLRQILCSKYRPKDGYDCTVTEAFPEGIPADTPVIEGEGYSSLPRGFAASIDPTLNYQVQAVARAKTIPPPADASQADHLGEYRRRRVPKT